MIDMPKHVPSARYSWPRQIAAGDRIFVDGRVAVVTATYPPHEGWQRCEIDEPLPGGQGEVWVRR